jgi:hypothetical protein
MVVVYNSTLTLEVDMKNIRFQMGIWAEHEEVYNSEAVALGLPGNVFYTTTEYFTWRVRPIGVSCAIHSTRLHGTAA